MRVPLLGGAYQSQSVIADAQRCVNLYPETNPKDCPSPTTHYPTPGLRTLATVAPAATGRGLYCATNGDLYGVLGNTLYYISPSWTFTALGTIAWGTTPVSMADNGETLVLVDGTPRGYQVVLTTRVFSQIVDPTGLFVGADKVDYLDGFLIFNQPGTGTFYTSLANTVTFDPTYFATKSAYPDILTTLIVVHRQLWLIGTKKSEIWYDAGSPLFPFAEFPGVFVEHGSAAKFSVAGTDDSVFWLQQDLQGKAVILEGANYKTRRISTHALENEMRKYSRLDDAIAFVYQQNGHVFYVITFPTADKTWVYDMATEHWHERAWHDENGALHRHRAMSHAFAYNENVVLDWGNGSIYAWDLETYSDAGVSIRRIRSWPHLNMGIGRDGQMIPADGKRMIFDEFIADIDAGQSPDYIPAAPPQMSLRWSDNRGNTFGNGVLQDFGGGGEYQVQPQWNRLGMARDRIFELSWDAPIKTALNGAFVEMSVLET